MRRGEEFGLAKALAEEARKRGLKVETFTIDMTGGGRPYSKWSSKERTQAERALVVPEPPFYGCGIDGNKLPKRHPFHGLNENGQRYAACAVYCGIIEEAHKSAGKSKLIFIGAAAG